MVDRFVKMPNFIPIAKKKNQPTVARAYLENVWKYHAFPEDIVSNWDGTSDGNGLRTSMILSG